MDAQLHEVALWIASVPWGLILASACALAGIYGVGSYLLTTYAIRRSEHWTNEGNARW